MIGTEEIRSSVESGGYWSFTEDERWGRCREVVVTEYGEAVCKDTGEVLGYAWDGSPSAVGDDTGVVFSDVKPISGKTVWYSVSAELKKKVGVAEELLGERLDWFVPVLAEYGGWARRNSGGLGMFARVVSGKTVALFSLYYRYLEGKMSYSEFREKARSIGFLYIDKRLLYKFRLWHDGVSPDDAVLFDKKAGVYRRVSEIRFEDVFPRK